MQCILHAHCLVALSSPQSAIFALFDFSSIDIYGASANIDFHFVSVLKSVGSFVGIFFGSFVLGCAMGLVTALLMKFSKLRDYPLLESAMFVIMSYSTFLFAEFAQLTGTMHARCM